MNGLPHAMTLMTASAGRREGERPELGALADWDAVESA
jgi:hypothetical protein